MAKIARNFSFLSASKALQKLINFATVVVLTRLLGLEGYGIISTAFSFGFLFNYFFDGGTNLFLIRETARNRSSLKKTLVTVFKLKLIISICTFFVMVAIAKLLNYNETIFYSILIFSGYLFFYNLSCTFYGAFTGLEKMEYESIIDVILRVLILLLIVFGVFLDINLPLIMFAYAGSAVTMFFVSLVVYIKKVQVNGRGEGKKITLYDILKETFPFAVGALMGEFFFHIDKVMLSKLSTISSVGLYNASYKLSYMGVFLASSVTMSFYPHFAKVWEKNQFEGTAVFNIIYKLLLAVSLPIALLTTFFSQEIVALVFGPEYEKSAPILQSLVWYVPPIYITHLTSRTIEAMGHQWFNAKSMLWCVVVNVILNSILIPFLGSHGASISTVLTSILVLAAHMWFLKKKMPGILKALNLSIIMASLVCALFTFILLNHLHWIALSIVSMLIYTFVIFALGAITKNELKRLKE